MGRITHLSHGWKLLPTLIILEVHLDFDPNQEWLYPRLLQINKYKYVLPDYDVKISHILLIHRKKKSNP